MISIEVTHRQGIIYFLRQHLFIGLSPGISNQYGYNNKL